MRDELGRRIVIWVALLSLVALVVGGGLTVIGRSLTAINGSLGTISRSVEGAESHTSLLPAHISSINHTLGRIDVVMKPLPSLTDQIVASLTSVDSTLMETDTTLLETSAVFASVFSSLNGFSMELGELDSPPDQVGVERVGATINALNTGALEGIGRDISGSLDSLVSVRQRLQAICSSTTVHGLGAVAVLSGRVDGRC